MEVCVQVCGCTYSRVLTQRAEVDAGCFLLSLSIHLETRIFIDLVLTDWSGWLARKPQDLPVSTSQRWYNKHVPPSSGVNGDLTFHSKPFAH